MLAARAAGKVITIKRPVGIARLLDTSIWLWFFEKDPLSIHVLTLAAYRCLEDLGKESGKGPIFKTAVGEEKFNTAYDFLRHASNNPQSGIDFPPSSNSFILFDAVSAFDRIFGNMTMYMRTFRAYFLVVGPDHQVAENLRSQANLFLPEGITIEEAEGLERLEFFAKLTEMFAVQYRVKVVP
jgi:hypothetical protein